MKAGTKVKVKTIRTDKIPKGREVLESTIGIAGIVESSHMTLNGTVNYVRLTSMSLSQPFYDRELEEDR